MDETNIQETTPDVLPDDNTDPTENVLDSGDTMVSDTGTDSELVESESTDESGVSESVSDGDSTSNILAYTEEERQADSELIGSINQLNATCTLILFFLLFAWVDKKVRFFTKGFTNGKSS